MIRLFFGAVAVGFGVSAGVFLWDFVTMPELGRMINGAVEKWSA